MVNLDRCTKAVKPVVEGPFHSDVNYEPNEQPVTHLESVKRLEHVYKEALNWSEEYGL